MRKIYLLLPLIEDVKKLVDELLKNRIPEANIHIIANSNLDLENLPEASVLQNSDLLPALQRGIAIGGSSGLFAGLVALAFPPAGIILAGGAVVLASTIAGAGIGAWASTLIGISAPHPEIKRFEAAIKEGQLLVLLDIPDERVESIKVLLRNLFPTIEIYDAEMPALTS